MVYDYQCKKGHDLEEAHPMGQAPTQTVCPCGTQAKRKYSFSISPSALPTRGGAGIGALKAQEKQTAQDYQAIQEMKREGIVPKTSMGAAKTWATARDKLEIETGHTYNDLKAAKEIHAELQVPKSMDEVKKINKENLKFAKDIS